MQLGNVMDTDKLSPSRTSLACLEHAHIHTVCISFSCSAPLIVEISLCSVPQENEMSAGFTLYQHFIHRSILFTSLSLSYFSPFFPFSILCQVRKGLIVPQFDRGQAPMPQRSRLHSVCPVLCNLSCLQDHRF